MSDLSDLLFVMRQHPGFQALLKAIEEPSTKAFRPDEDPAKQNADWIFRSGRLRQHNVWRDFLVNGIPQAGELKASRKE
jgi:hypothetical protein